MTLENVSEPADNRKITPYCMLGLRDIDDVEQDDPQHADADEEQEQVRKQAKNIGDAGHMT